MKVLGRLAREKILEIIAAALAAAFLFSGRITPRAALRAIDVDLLLLLFALLVTVEILNESGYLELLVERAVARFRTKRSFAFAMVAFTGALAALVTNDVALFVVIPFTVIASRYSDFDLEDCVILEVIAANLLGCLTPLGNPQNLFVFHRSGWSAMRFVAEMGPFVGWSAVGLVIAVLFFFRGGGPSTGSAELHSPASGRVRRRPPLHPRAAVAGALCFALVVLEIARVINAWPAAIAALIAGIVILRRKLFDVDLSIVPLFFFAFIVVEGLQTFAWAFRTNTYLTSILLSQVISNVPATVLLTPFSQGDWRALLYGVNAGGCGTIIASLANLLGWRIYARESGRDPRFFWRLTAINFVFLVWVGAGGFFIA